MLRTSTLCALMLGCGGPSSSPDQTSESAIGARSLPILAATQYAIFHGQDYSTDHFADMGRGLYPIVGNVYEPGGPRHMIAEAGKPLVIEYDRYVAHYQTSACPSPDATTYVIYPSCGEQSCGEPPPPCDVYKLYRQVLLHYQIAGGAVETVTIPPLYSTGGQPRASIALPSDASGDLAYWFELTREDGSTEWDSRYAANYPVEVLSPPTATLNFDSSWNDGVDGTVTAGATLRIAYDRARLVQQVWGNTPFGPNSIRIDAYVSFDGAAAVALPIDEDYGSLLQPLVRVPRGTRNIAIWFKGEGDVYVAQPGSNAPRREHHVAWDSRFGANYHFAVSP